MSPWNGFLPMDLDINKTNSFVNHYQHVSD